eukprot:m.42951 g.42951  ORF g.42951 m.42951 type:complete len:1095 (+) comp6345_c0_seq1:237-3521(+)
MIRRFLRRRGSQDDELDDDEGVWLHVEHGPKTPPSSLPERAGKSILRSDPSAEAPLPTSQSRTAAKEWEKREAQRSVYANARRLSDAVAEANARWARMKLPKRSRLPLPKRSDHGLSGSTGRGSLGSQRSRRRRQLSVRFDPAIGTTKAEMLDQMVKAPRGLLCRAIKPYRLGAAAVNQGGIYFDVNDVVLALQPVPDMTGTAGGMMDGVAHGIRGAFPGDHVERLDTQPTDMTFMWTNELPSKTDRTRLAAIHGFDVHAHAPTKDMELEGMDTDTDADDGEGAAAAAVGTVGHHQLVCETDEVGLVQHSGDNDTAMHGKASGSAPTTTTTLGADGDDNDNDDEDFDDFFVAAMAIEDDGDVASEDADVLLAPQGMGLGMDGSPLPEHTTTTTHTALGGASTTALGGGDGAADHGDASGNDHNTGEDVWHERREGRSRSRSWGRKPLASPPPLRRARESTELVLDTRYDVEQYRSSSARGWVRRSRRRKQQRRHGAIVDGDLHATAPEAAGPSGKERDTTSASGRGPAGASGSHEAATEGSASLAGQHRSAHPTPPADGPDATTTGTHSDHHHPAISAPSSPSKPAVTTTVDMQATETTTTTTTTDSDTHPSLDAAGSASGSRERILKQPQASTESKLSSASSSPSSSRASRPKADAHHPHHSVNLLSRLKSTLARATMHRPTGAYSERELEFLRRCFAALEEKGLDYEGIYRTAGQTSKVNALYAAYVMKKHDADFKSCDSATLTSAVKHVFREASEAALSPYDVWMDAMRRTKVKTPERTAVLAANFEALPVEKRNVMTVLLRHLHKVVALSDVNKMAPRNLGVVFGPTLLRIGNDVADIADVPVAAQIVAGLIELTAPSCALHDLSMRPPALAPVRPVSDGTAAAVDALVAMENTPPAFDAAKVAEFFGIDDFSDEKDDADGDAVDAAADVDINTTVASQSSEHPTAGNDAYVKIVGDTIESEKEPGAAEVTDNDFDQGESSHATGTKLRHTATVFKDDDDIDVNNVKTAGTDTTKVRHTNTVFKDDEDDHTDGVNPTAMAVEIKVRHTDTVWDKPQETRAERAGKPARPGTLYGFGGLAVDLESDDEDIC